MMIAASRTPSSRQHRDAEQVDGIDLGAEATQLIGALECHHDADQERQEADDRRRVETGLLHLADRRAQPQPAGMPQRPQHRHDDEAAETEDRIAAPQNPDRDLAEAREKAGEGSNAAGSVRRWRHHAAVAQLLEQRQVIGRRLSVRPGSPGRQARARCAAAARRRACRAA